MQDPAHSMGGGAARHDSPGPGMAEVEPLDAFVAPGVRRSIEEAYGARIEEQASLAAVLADPTFLEGADAHVALYADHGVVHARDVARQLLQVLDIADGRLFPARTPDRLAWMKAYGVLLACLHDIGMINSTASGRAEHPEFATQALLGPEFDAIVGRVQDDDRCGIAGRLDRLHRAGGLGSVTPATVLREALAMANCHSKSKVPTALLNDRGRLRRAMREAASRDLSGPHRTARPAAGASFAWLELADPALVDDVVDTLRALRCADALRQRGTALKTSGNYEIFVDERSGNAIYALRPDDGHLYLLEVTDPIAAGEANLASSQLDANGDLRISFHHGAFRGAATMLKAANSAALVVSDIQADAIGSFAREDRHPGLRRTGEVRILIEAVEENPAFAGRVRAALRRLNPAAAARVRLVASLDVAAPGERSRYLRSADVRWGLARRREVLGHIARSGYRAEAIDAKTAFREVRGIELRAGEALIEAGSSSGFVYVPMGDGLRGLPLGGYPGFTIRPWVLVGITGVVRGAVRNSGVLAERDIELLAIPKRVFLDRWHATYDLRGFAARLRQ